VKLVTIRVTVAGGRALGGEIKGRCQTCGQEVYLSAAAVELIPDLNLEVICTICFCLVAKQTSAVVVDS